MSGGVDDPGCSRRREGDFLILVKKGHVRKHGRLQDEKLARMTPQCPRDPLAAGVPCGGDPRPAAAPDSEEG